MIKRILLLGTTLLCWTLVGQSDPFPTEIEADPVVQMANPPTGTNLQTVPALPSAAAPAVGVQAPIKIGTLLFNPPFEANDPTHNVYNGFEMDIMNEVCRRLKWNCQYQTFSTLKDVFIALTVGQVKVVVGSVIILKGDGEHLFTTPYLPSGIQFFAKKTSKINSLEDVTKSRIGTINDPLVKMLVTVQYAKTYPVTSYDTAQAGIDDLVLDNIDVFVLQTASTKYWLSMSADTFKLVGQPIPLGFGNGAMTMKGADDVINQMDKALLAI